MAGHERRLELALARSLTGMRARAKGRPSAERSKSSDPELSSMNRRRFSLRPCAARDFAFAGRCRSSKRSGETDGARKTFRCTAWRSVAENAAKSLHKGDRVMVVGRLIQRAFEKDGQKRTTIEVQVQHVGPDLQFAVADVHKATVRRTRCTPASAGSSARGPAWAGPRRGSNS